MPNVEEKVTKIIVERLGVAESLVTMDATFKEDLGADSIRLVELVMELEDEFDAQLSDDEVESIKTVGDAISFIKSKI